MQTYNNIINAIDVGTSKVCILSAEQISEKHTKIIGFSSTDSNGLSKGNISDQESITLAVAKVKSDVEKMTGIPITNAYSNISGSHLEIKSMSNSHGNKLENKIITSEDLALYEKNIEQKHKILDQKRALFEHLNTKYRLDNSFEIKDPTGMHRSNMEFVYRGVTGEINLIDKLEGSIKDAGINTLNFVSNISSSGESTLVESEKLGQTVVIDIGAGVTDIGVFNSGDLNYLKIIPIGGINFSKDIAFVTGISLKNAEELKLKYGSAQWDASNSDIVDSISEETGETIQIDIKDIALLTRERATELCQLLRISLENICEEKDDIQFVLTGGGSNLPGLSNLISKHFCAPVRIAKPYIESSKFQDILNNQIYSTLIGTLRLANENTASNSFNLNQSENLQFSKNIFSKLLS